MRRVGHLVQDVAESMDTVMDEPYWVVRMGIEQVAKKESWKNSFSVYKMVLCSADNMAVIKVEMMEMN